MMNLYLRRALLGAMASGLITSAFAAGVGEADEEFMTKAAHAGQFEIQTSALAEKSAGSDGVKEFAQKMIEDHTKADDELRKLAEKKEVSLAVGLTPQQQDRLAELANVSGVEFDRKYVQEVGVAAHSEAVALFESAAADAQDKDVKAYAGKTLPHLREHQKLANQLHAEIEKTP